jgi:cytochrome c oxidase subunit 3
VAVGELPEPPGRLRPHDRSGRRYAHHSLISGERKGVLYGSIATVLLAIIFTIFQGIEYNVSSFTISDGIFGTSFFFSTGFHGLHVIIGTIFLSVAL